MKLMMSLALIGILGATAGAETPQINCTDLHELRLPQTEVLSVEYKMAGPYTSMERSPSAQKTHERLPGYCIVKLASHPSSDSDIRIELWLPEPDAWNGKFLGTGNGGYSSMMFYDQMAEGLARGYAVGASDTGHPGDDMHFAIGHPEKVKDWAFRATHMMAEQGRAVSKAFYGKPLTHAYFRGCSTGGQQALSEAQRYPMDFDGIIAGDPGHDRAMLNVDFVKSWLATNPPDGPRFPAKKLPALHRAVIAACDKDDGVVDGIITDPRTCRFDPASLRCAAGTNNDSCLTDAEIKAVQTLYDGPVRDKAGRQLYPGWTKSSEGGWGPYLVSAPEPVRFTFWRLWIYGDPNMTPEQLQPEAALARSRAMYPYIDATDPNLRPFAKRHGKLLLYHGWADPIVPSENSIEYYDAVKKTVGDQTEDFARLFMVPGMSHCGGGPGATAFDMLGTLDAWVTEGKAPERILATHLEDGKPTLTRPLCAYPLEAKWDGVHDTHNATSFTCAKPTKDR